MSISEFPIASISATVVSPTNFLFVCRHNILIFSLEKSEILHNFSVKYGNPLIIEIDNIFTSPDSRYVCLFSSHYGLEYIFLIDMGVSSKSFLNIEPF